MLLWKFRELTAATTQKPRCSPNLTSPCSLIGSSSSQPSCPTGENPTETYHTGTGFVQSSTDQGADQGGHHPGAAATGATIRGEKLGDTACISHRRVEDKQLMQSGFTSIWAASTTDYTAWLPHSGSSPSAYCWYVYLSAATSVHLKLEASILNPFKQ